MPPTITIPRTLTGGRDLVVIPRTLYEHFVRSVKVQTSRTPTDEELDKAIAEYHAGDFDGPFTTVKEGVAFLETRRAVKRKK